MKENKGMNVLILTGKFGMGHWSASQALQQQLEREGHQVHTVDFFDYAMPLMMESVPQYAILR